MNPLIGAALISGAASLGGGFMSAFGGAQANAQNAALNYANMDMQRDINTANQTFQNNVNVANWAFQDKVNQQNFDFAREMTGVGQRYATSEAQKQMDFQERMSSTAYQRAMADMRKAGLNPILAYQQGGASAPGGAMGVSSPMGASAQSTSGQAVKVDAPQARFQMGNTQEELGRAIGRIATSAVDTYRSGEQAKLIGKQAETQDWQTDKVMHDAAISRDLRFKVNADTDNAKSQNEVIKAQADLVRAQAGSARARASVDSETARQIGKYGMPGYGLGERALHTLSDQSSGPISLPPPSWPFNN